MKVYVTGLRNALPREGLARWVPVPFGDRAPGGVLAGVIIGRLAVEIIVASPESELDVLANEGRR